MSASAASPPLVRWSSTGSETASRRRGSASISRRSCRTASLKPFVLKLQSRKALQFNPARLECQNSEMCGLLEKTSSTDCQKGVHCQLLQVASLPSKSSSDRAGKRRQE